METSGSPVEVTVAPVYAWWGLSPSQGKAGRYALTPLAKKLQGQSTVWTTGVAFNGFDDDPPVGDKADMNETHAVTRDVLQDVVRLPSLPVKVESWRRLSIDEYIILSKAALDCGVSQPKWINNPTGHKLRGLLIRLAHASPDLFDGLYDPTTGSLADHPCTRIWSVANSHLGSFWTSLSKVTPPPAPATPATPELNDRAVRFQTLQRKSTPLGSFIHGRQGVGTSTRPKWQESHARSTNTEDTREFQSFATLRFATVQSGTISDRKHDISHQFMAAIDVLRKRDANLILYPFPITSRHPAYVKPVKRFTSQSRQAGTEAILPYVDRLYVGRGPTMVRFFFGHARDRVSLRNEEVDEWCFQHGIMFSIDKIQAPRTVVCGWLLASHPSTNLEHFHESVQMHPRLQQNGKLLEVDLQHQTIKLDYDEKSTYKRRVSAVHIRCDADYRRSTLRALKAIWNKTVRSGETSDLPDGRRLKFIPSNSNRNDRRAVGETRLSQARSRLKQRKFLADHKTVEIPWVKDLDIPCDVPRDPANPDEDKVSLSLREALLTTKTSSNWQHPLFLSVDRILVDDEWRVHALYNASNSFLQSEAITMATYIFTLLEARFGTQAVSSWFYSDAQATAAGMVWDPATKMVVSNHTDTNDELNSPLYGTHQSWELLDDFDDFDEDDSEQPAVAFELSNHFSLAPPVDLTSCRDSGSTQSFTTGITEATKAIAEQTAADVRIAAGTQEIESVHSDITGSTLNTATGNQGGGPWRTPKTIPGQGSTSIFLPHSSEAAQQTLLGEGHE